MATLTNNNRGSRTREGLITYTRTHSVDSEDECETVGESFVNGLPESDRTWEQVQSGAGRYKVTITYQGCRDDDGQDTVSVRQVIREEPIESHPLIEQIKAYYGGVEDPNDGTIKFPLKLTKTAAGSRLGKKAKTTKNPMFGTRTYGRKSAEWSRTYVRKTLPSNLLDMAGTLSDKPPGAPTAPAGKTWVYGTPEAVLRGGAFQITEKATLENEEVAKAVYATLV